MIVQKHLHLNGQIAVMRFRRGGYDMTLENYDPKTKQTTTHHLERYMTHTQANAWMETERKTRRK